MPVSRLPRLVLALVAVLLVTACATKVSRVLADPSRYRDREVTVSGAVSDSFSVLNRGVYRVEDRTGSLWVFSDHGVPRTGSRVSVSGTIREGFNLGPLASRVPAGIAAGVILVDRSHRVRD